MLSSEQNHMSLRAQINAISEMCQPLLHNLHILESQVPCTLRVYNRLEELQFYLESRTKFLQSLDTLHKQGDALNLDSRSQNLMTYQSAFHSAADKLLKYISDTNQETCGQPRLKVLMAIRILYLACVCLLEHTKCLYDASIPGVFRRN